MSDLNLWLDIFTIITFSNFLIDKGGYKFVNGIVFLILIAIRLIGKYDLAKGKKLDIDELKEQYPEIYYKYYATEIEKMDWEDRRFIREIDKIIMKEPISDFQMWLEENEDLVTNILFSIAWLFFGILLMYILRS